MTKNIDKGLSQNAVELKWIALEQYYCVDSQQEEEPSLVPRSSTVNNTLYFTKAHYSVQTSQGIVDWAPALRPQRGSIKSEQTMHSSYTSPK